MATKDIKVGNFYHVLVKVLGIDPKNGEITTETVNEFGTSLNMEPTYFARCEKEAFSEITPKNGTKNIKTAPKYDPCRLFRKGDKVRVVERDGRDYIDYDPYTNIQKSELYTVLENEEEVIDGGCVGIRIGKGNVEYEIPFYFLELVTPVEKLERYVVEPSDVAYFIVDKKHESGEQNVVMYMFAFHPHAKEAAEAECARLNAEHRKEQK